MQHNLEATYHRSLPDFIRVLPDGIRVGEELQPTVSAVIEDEQVVRKLWDHGKLLCQSIDGVKALVTGKACRVCSDLRRCTPQIVLFLLVAETPFRMALNYTSAQNYLIYRRSVLDKGSHLHDVLTCLSILSHTTWGEVQFQEVF
jgi:hypothetical protein